MPPVSASGINLRLWLKAYRDYFCQFTFSGLILTDCLTMTSVCTCLKKSKSFHISFECWLRFVLSRALEHMAGIFEAAGHCRGADFADLEFKGLLLCKTTGKIQQYCYWLVQKLDMQSQTDLWSRIIITNYHLGQKVTIYNFCWLISFIELLIWKVKACFFFFFSFF